MHVRYSTTERGDWYMMEASEFFRRTRSLSAVEVIRWVSAVLFDDDGFPLVTMERSNAVATQWLRIPNV